VRRASGGLAFEHDLLALPRTFRVLAAFTSLMATGVTITGAAGHISPLASLCLYYRQRLSSDAIQQCDLKRRLLAFQRALGRRRRRAGRAAEACMCRLGPRYARVLHLICRQIGHHT
jgi:hypothetical protein